jgi:type I restriction enzyme, S subunit
MTLPKGWTKANLGDFTLERVKQGEPGATAVPYIDIGSIDRDLKRVGPTEMVSRANAPTRARQWVKPGDVLVSLTRPNLNAVAIVLPELAGAVASTGFDVLRPEGVIPEWVFNRVRSQAFVSDVCEDVQGVVYPAIRPADVRRHNLPIPPVQEQRRIVEAIDSYLTRLDDAVASLERVQTKLKSYRASVLKAAVEGRLVPTEASLAHVEKRGYEPAEALLRRILKERQRRWQEAERTKLEAAGRTPRDDKWKAKYEQPVAPDMSTLPELPEGWCWATVDQLSRSVFYGSSAKASEEGDVPVIRMGNIVDGCLNLTELKFLSADHEEFPALLLKPGDLLFNRTNSAELVGKTAIYNGAPAPCSFASYLICVRALDEVESAWICHAINSLYGRLWIASVVTQQVGQANVNGTKLKAFAVPLPPLVEQQRLLSLMDELFSTCEASQTSVGIELRRVSRLRQAVLKWAFEGKLVDQEPTDEPAEKLLAPIRAERATGSAVRKPIGRRARGAA